MHTMRGSQFIYKWLVGSLLSLAFAWGLCALGGVLLQRLAGEPYDYLQYYYRFVNYLPDDGGTASPETDIILIDAHDASLGSRQGIARLLDSLGRYPVKAVGLDAIFQSTSEFADEDDALLQQAVARFPRPLVVASRQRDLDSLEHSFFTLPTGVDFGTTNAQSFFGFVPRDSVSGRSVEKMVAVLARKAGYSVPEDMIVNYTNRAFQCIHSWDHLNASFLAGKIVLIGDDKDSRDSFDLPFPIEGKYSVSGMRINAYQLASLIHPEISFRVVSPGVSQMVSVFLILLYGFLLCGWIAFVKRTRDGWPKMGLYFLEPILVIAIEFIAVLAMILIVKRFCWIPNILLFMAAVPIAGTCHKMAIEFFDGLSLKKTSK